MSRRPVSQLLPPVSFFSSFFFFLFSFRVDVAVLLLLLLLELLLLELLHLARDALVGPGLRCDV